MQDYNTIIGAIQMRLNKCPTRSVMDRFRIGSSTLNLILFPSASSVFFQETSNSLPSYVTLSPSDRLVLVTTS